MTKQELVNFVAKELAAIEGGWQSLELRTAKALHSAQHLVKTLLEAGHLKEDNDIKEPEVK